MPFMIAGAVGVGLILLATIAVSHVKFYRDWRKSGEQPEASEKKAES